MKKKLGKVYAKMFASDANRFAENNPSVIAERNAGKIRNHVGISLIVGSKDEFLERNRALDQRLKELNIPHEFEIVPGAGHDKDDVYAKAATRGFQFSLRHFGTERKEK